MSAKKATSRTSMLKKFGLMRDPWSQPQAVIESDGQLRPPRDDEVGQTPN